MRDGFTALHNASLRKWSWFSLGVIIVRLVLWLWVRGSYSPRPRPCSGPGSCSMVGAGPATSFARRGVPVVMAQWKRTQPASVRRQVQFLTSLCGFRSGVAVSCGVGHRCSSDLALLWLWHRLVAVAPILPLAWELPYSTDVALKRPKINKKTLYTLTKREKLHQFSVQMILDHSLSKQDFI